MISLLFSSSSTAFGDNSPKKSHKKLVNFTVGIGDPEETIIIVFKGNSC